MGNIDVVINSDFVPPPSRISDTERKLHAVTYVQRLDYGRAAEDRIKQGVGDLQIASELNTDVEFVQYARELHERFGDAFPGGPYEVGLRRFLGHISSEDMMKWLREWSYSFGHVVMDTWSPGNWDEVQLLYFGGYLTETEYRELYQLTRSQPQPADLQPDPW